MEKLEKYRRAVRQVLQDYAQNKPAFSEIETELICDGERDHYQIVKLGWREFDRTYGCSVHFDIKDGKIWIQHNATEVDFAAKLMDEGVDKSDIVLGFQAPYKRAYTGFAVA